MLNVVTVFHEEPKLLCITFATFSPIVFLNESRNSLRLCSHVSGESAQIVELSLQGIRRGLSFDKFLHNVLCGKQITNYR